MGFNQILGLICFEGNWKLIFRDFGRSDQRQFLNPSSKGVAFKL